MMVGNGGAFAGAAEGVGKMIPRTLPISGGDNTVEGFSQAARQAAEA
jgi:hypothetical protein